jgi:hypothetical protein
MREKTLEVIALNGKANAKTSILLYKLYVPYPEEHIYHMMHDAGNILKN